VTRTQFNAAFASTFCDDAGLTPHAGAEGVLWRYATAFAKTVLSGEHGYQNVLTPGWALDREPYAQFFVTERRNGLTPDTEFPDADWFFMVQPGNDDMPELPSDGSP
jgi:hypothetical protein